MPALSGYTLRSVIGDYVPVPCSSCVSWASLYVLADWQRFADWQFRSR